MAESDLPSSWSHAGRIALGNALWILPLLAGERLLDGAFAQATGVTAAWFVAIALAVKLHVIQELARNRQRYPQMFTWAFVIGGAALLALGIYRLSSSSDGVIAPPPASVLTSNLPRYVRDVGLGWDSQLPLGLNGTFNVTTNRIRLFVDISNYQVPGHWSTRMRFALGDIKDAVKYLQFNKKMLYPGDKDEL